MTDEEAAQAVYEAACDRFGEDDVELKRPPGDRICIMIPVKGALHGRRMKSLRVKTLEDKPGIAWETGGFSVHRGLAQSEDPANEAINNCLAMHRGRRGHYNDSADFA